MLESLWGPLLGMLAMAGGSLLILSILWLWRQRNAAQRAALYWFRLYLRAKMPSLHTEVISCVPDPNEWEEADE